MVGARGAGDVIVAVLWRNAARHGRLGEQWPDGLEGGWAKSSHSIRGFAGGFRRLPTRDGQMVFETTLTHDLTRLHGDISCGNDLQSWQRPPNRSSSELSLVIPKPTLPTP